MYSNEARFNREIKLNSSLEAIYIHHLVKDMTYKIYMSAFNNAGEGVKSDLVLVGKY